MGQHRGPAAVSADPKKLDRIGVVKTPDGMDLDPRAVTVPALGAHRRVPGSGTSGLHRVTPGGRWSMAYNSVI